MATTSGRTVFVLGSELAGNRQAIIVEASQEYSLDAGTNTVYTAQTAKFPYTVQS